MESFTERLNFLIDSLFNGKKGDFANTMGIPASTVSEYCSGKKENPQLSFLKPLLEKVNNLNATWLLTGAGKMLIDGSSLSPKSEDINELKKEIERLLKIESDLRYTVELQKRTIREVDEKLQLIIQQPSKKA